MKQIFHGQFSLYDTAILIFCQTISGKHNLLATLASLSLLLKDPLAEEMGLGSTSICAALLHDVVEDTDYTVEDISNIFGAKVAQIVDGLTKISGGIFGDKASAQIGRAHV